MKTHLSGGDCQCQVGGFGSSGAWQVRIMMFSFCAFGWAMVQWGAEQGPRHVFPSVGMAWMFSSSWSKFCSNFLSRYSCFHVSSRQHHGPRGFSGCSPQVVTPVHYKDLAVFSVLPAWPRLLASGNRALDTLQEFITGRQSRSKLQTYSGRPCPCKVQLYELLIFFDSVVSPSLGKFAKQPTPLHLLRNTKQTSKQRGIIAQT